MMWSRKEEFMLKLENVSKFYYTKGMISTGFTKVSLELKMGEFVVITGESGSGKSTLLNVLSGLDSYEEGEMYIDGKETSHYTEKDFEDYRRKYVANIFQSFNLVNSYTVYQNVELVLLLNGYKKKEIKAKVLDMIDQVGLTEFKNTKVSKLSGGQKQRVAIARAMVKETPIIVADEPTGNLDSASAKEVIQILKKVAKDKLVIMVTHNMEQVEEVATRVIKMHDGRMIENTCRKPVEKELPVKQSAYNKIGLINQGKLGIRNTFNLVTKFCLLFFVFFFVSSAILAEYASFQMSEEKNKKEITTMIFSSPSEKRIIINKQDRSQFTQEDYEKIKAIPGVDYVVEDDVLIDGLIKVQQIDNEMFGMDILAQVYTIDNFKGKLTYGRMPENETEAIMVVDELKYFVTDRLEDVLNQPFKITDSQRDSWSSEDPVAAKITIVGIEAKPHTDWQNQEEKIYVSEEVHKKVRKITNKNYSTGKQLMNNRFYTYEIGASPLVKSGTAVITEEMKTHYKNGNAKKQPIDIFVETPYYKEELHLTVAEICTQKNYRRVIGESNYNACIGRIFISEEDYDYLYNKPSYQSSVYVKDTDQLEQTLTTLNSMGIHPKKITDFVVKDSFDASVVIRIIKIVVTIIVILVLFFISYFVIYLILKSRRFYYITLRVLGATYQNVRKILAIELVTNATIAYTALRLFLICVQKNILHMEGVAELLPYLNGKEYLLMYGVILGISLLISMKFTKKIFQKSAMKTYHAE